VAKLPVNTLSHKVPPSVTWISRVVWMLRHLAVKVGNVQHINREKGRTISLKAAVHPGHMLRALMMKKKKSVLCGKKFPVF